MHLQAILANPLVVATNLAVSRGLVTSLLVDDVPQCVTRNEYNYIWDIISISSLNYSFLYKISLQSLVQSG